MKNIYVILGSTRPNRRGEKVAEWFMEAFGNYEGLNFELIDLADWNLPFLDEPKSPSAGDYQHEHTKKWAKKIDKADGFIIITPEYNHGYPAVLKNALDFLYAEWNGKPVGFVSYGGAAGGVRAVEQLRQVAVELQMHPLRGQVAIPIFSALGEDGNFKDTSPYEKAAQGMLAELAGSLN